MVKTIKLLLIVLSIFTTLSFGYEHTFTDLGIAHRLSMIEKKLLLINFSSPSCYYCKLFEKEVLPNKDVQEILRGNYIFVKIEPGSYKTTFLGKTYTNDQLFGGFAVRGTPTFVFLKDQGQVTQVPGFMPAPDFLKALRFIVKVVDENYKGSFEEYSKKNDDYKGKPTIVNVKKEDADYVLKYDKNAQSVDAVPSKVDINTLYVTTNSDVAKKLNGMGVIRVLLVSSK
ncbi:thioredoxin family protein [Fervidobacterium gondwanense]|uniref:Thioredoxin-related protein n=1 Tax=Fervidobacterium gondwanense DSM 13020 TaxID=1121883 RepID=A0A1M7SK71_FERGO|nr:thioredoxin fold domain-containing protein [Fervidobacterium gondwanense]SHN58846.1 Thioredoxin-related protein [Fervidobacterium gondwanense DSM 13020]